MYAQFIGHCPHDESLDIITLNTQYSDQERTKNIWVLLAPETLCQPEAMVTCELILIQTAS